MIDSTRRFTHRVMSRLRSFLRWLIEPAPSVRESLRQRTRLVNQFLVFAALVELLLGAIQTLLNPETFRWPQGNFVLTLTSLVVELIAYWLSRRGHYRLAVLFMLSMATTIVCLGALQAVDILDYLILPILFCSVVFSLRESIAFVGINIVAMLAYLALVPGTNWQTFVTGRLLFIIIGSILLLAMAKRGEVLEANRQAQFVESEQRFRDLFANNPLPMWVYDPKTLDFLDVNETAITHYGYSREGFAKMRLLDLLIAEPGDARSGGGSQPVFSGERQIRLKNGRIIDVSIAAHGIMHIGKSAVLAVAQDVSEKLASQRAIQRSEERFRSLVQYSSDLISVLDMDGTIHYQSSSLERILGCSPEYWLGKTILEFVHPEEIVRLSQLLADIVEKPGELVSAELRFRHRDGSWRTLDGTFSNLYDNPAVGGIVANLHDSTKRKRAEQALLEERNLLRTLLDIMPDSIYVKDPDSRYLMGNIAVAQHLGLPSPDEMVGLAEQNPNYRADDQAVMRSGQILIDREEPGLDIDGKPMWLLTTKAPLRGPDGNIDGVVGITRDITARRQAEEALRYRDTLLEALTSISAQFLRATDLERVLPDAIACLGEATHVSRVHIYENQTLADGTLVARSRCEWTSPGTAPMRGLPEHQIINYSIVDGAYERLAANGMFSGATPSFSPGLRALLQAAGTLSMAIVSVFCGDEFWGLLAFSECRAEREWLTVEVEAMRNAGSALGAALLRQRAEAAEHEQRVLGEALRESAAAINSSLQVDEVLRRILAGVDRVVPYDAANVMLIDKGLARIVACRGYAERGLEAAALKVELPVAKTAMVRRAIATGQVQIIPDAQEEPQWVSTDVSGWIRANMCAPLHVDGQVIGLLNLDGAEPGKFSADDAQRLRAFTEHVATALNNAQLYKEIQRDVAQLDTLRQLALDLTASLDLASVTQTLASGMIQLVHGHSGALFRYLPERELLEVVASIGTNIAPVGLQLRVGEGLVGRAAARRTTISVENYEAWEGRSSQATPYIFGSAIAVPIIWQGELLGVFNVVSGDPAQTFSIRDAKLLGLLAGQAAIALENSQLYEKLQHDADDLRSRVDQRTIELNRSKEHVEAVLNNSSDAILVTRPDGKIRQVNPAFNALFGCLPDEAFGKSLSTFVDASYVTSLNTALASVGAGSNPLHVELEARRMNGSVFSADIGLSGMSRQQPQGATATPMEVVCTIRDITQRKHAEEDLRRAFEKEKELSGLKSRFISMASHDLRTPLTVILSSTEMLEYRLNRSNGTKDLDSLNKHLVKIADSVRQMTRLIDDVLLVSKADAGRLELKPETIDIERFCRDILQEIQVTASSEHRLTYRFKGQPATAAADSHLLRQILTNLLSNAVKYSPTGGQVVLDVERVSGQLQFCIQDEGIGIPDEDQSRLFEPFHRARNVGTVKGTGLGMAITKRGVDALGGTIEFESHVGKGTQFCIFIPCD